MSFIEFYDRKSPYYEFSNFYPSPVEIGGQIWPTSEHYYQASKFLGTSRRGDEYTDIIRQADTPSKAFFLARHKANRFVINTYLNKKDDRKIGDLIKEFKDLQIRDDWDEIRDEIMYDVVLAKFTQHTELRNLLLDTGDSILIERSKDRHWGNGLESGDGIPISQGGTMNGENRLGMILMLIREEISSGTKVIGIKDFIFSRPKIVSPKIKRLELEKILVVELRGLAKEAGLRGYSKLRKSELIDLILKN